jgi:hypothetical protein
MKSNMYHLIDLKANIIFALFMAVSFSEVEITMKVIAFVLTVGYTSRRWYLLEKNKKDE